VGCEVMGERARISHISLALSRISVACCCTRSLDASSSHSASLCLISTISVSLVTSSNCLCRSCREAHTQINQYNDQSPHINLSSSLFITELPLYLTIVCFLSFVSRFLSCHFFHFCSSHSVSSDLKFILINCGCTH